MLQTSALPTDHADLVTDVAYDFYGQRIAMGSADQKIKIWRKDSKARSGWELEAEWKAHDAPIVRLSWAHPEFGTILASSSYDRTVRVWEEVGSLPQNSSTTVLGASASAASGNHQDAVHSNGNTAASPSRRWVERALLNEARGSVRGVEFGPNAFGLKLASISTDAYLRIYTSSSPSLNDWQVTHSLSVPSMLMTSSVGGAGGGPLGNYTGDQGMATSGPDASSSFVPSETGTSHPHGSSLTSTQSAHDLTQHELSVSGGGNASARNGNSSSNATGPLLVNPGKGNEALGGWTLSWCKEKWWGSVLAVCSGHNGIIKIISLSSSQPVAVLVLPPPTSSNNVSHMSASGGAQPQSKQASLGAQAITSLSWAPSCGRSYHLIASGHRDGTVRVWKIRPAESSAIGGGGAGAGVSDGGSGMAWSGSVMGEWGLGEATIGRVEWNITGSILSVASEDGRVRLYKATYSGKWECMGTFSAEAQPEDAGRDHTMQV